MDTGTFLAIGALVVSLGSWLTDRISKRRSGDQGDRTVTVQEGDLSLRRLESANSALERRADDLDERLVRAEEKLEACEARERQAKSDAEERERRWKAEVDGLMTLLIRHGITP